MGTVSDRVLSWEGKTIVRTETRQVSRDNRQAIDKITLIFSDGSRADIQANGDDSFWPLRLEIEVDPR